MSVDSGIRHVARRACCTAREEGSPFFSPPAREGRKKKNSRSAILLFKTNPKLGGRRAKDREGSEGGEGRQEGGKNERSHTHAHELSGSLIRTRSPRCLSAPLTSSSSSGSGSSSGSTLLLSTSRVWNEATLTTPHPPSASSSLSSLPPCPSLSPSLPSHHFLSL